MYCTLFPGGGWGIWSPWSRRCPWDPAPQHSRCRWIHRRQAPAWEQGSTTGYLLPLLSKQYITASFCFRNNYRLLGKGTGASQLSIYRHQTHNLKPAAWPKEFQYRLKRQCQAAFDPWLLVVLVLQPLYLDNSFDLVEMFACAKTSARYQWHRWVRFLAIIGITNFIWHRGVRQDFVLTSGCFRGRIK